MARTPASKNALLAFALLQALPAAAVELDLEVGVASTAVYRGVRLVEDGPVYRALLEARSEEGYYAGVWASRVDYAFDDRSREIDYFAGYHKRIDPRFALDLTLLRYTYDEDVRGHSYDWSEAQLAAHVGDSWTVLLSAADDWLGRDEKHYVLESTFRRPLPNYFVGYVTVGHQFTDRVIDQEYTYWQVGLTRPLRGFHVTVEHTGIEGMEPFGPMVESQFLFSVTKSFSLHR